MVGKIVEPLAGGVNSSIKIVEPLAAHVIYSIKIVEPLGEGADPILTLFARSILRSIFCYSFSANSAGNPFWAIWRHLGVRPCAPGAQNMHFHCGSIPFSKLIAFRWCPKFAF